MTYANLPDLLPEHRATLVEHADNQIAELTRQIGSGAGLGWVPVELLALAQAATARKAFLLATV